MRKYFIMFVIALVLSTSLVTGGFKNTASENDNPMVIIAGEEDIELLPV